MKSLTRLTLVACACVVMMLAGCFGSSTVEGQGEKPPECAVDDDCAARDKDDDKCTKWGCESSSSSPAQCVEQLAKSVDCECNKPSDCEDWFGRCGTVTCEAHKCVKTIAPAGPAAETHQRKGDCKILQCDGINLRENRQDDLEDIPNDNNDCTIDTCNPNPTNIPHANGAPCNGGAGVCFEKECIPCKPQNPASCGAEGPGEPSNNESATPYGFVQDKAFCGFSSGTDVDWYTFDFHDGSGNDILYFHFWSNAPTVEVCAFAKCNTGQVKGGCVTPGPQGSEGCCWSGPPNTFAPTWDIDCSDTTDDSGKLWISVKTPGANACEPYIIKGGY